MSPVGLPPGFRFHPTDEELVVYYLKRKINRYSIELDVIPEVDLYKCEPWELPAKSFLPSKDHEWFFFSPLDRKYPNGSRTNRATKAGYWKATGKDRKVSSQKCEVGMKKTLVYYKGRAPHGLRTEWIMHEYRLHEKECENSPGLQDLYSLCRVFKKTTPTPKIIEQFPASYGEQLHSMCNDSSPTIELSSDGRDEAYPFTPDTCSLETLRGSPFYSSAPKDSEWMQFLADDALNSFATPSSNLNMLPCIPSDVDVASECVKLQHRLSLPTLELEDFPHIDVMDSRALQFGIPQENMNPGDIFQGFINSSFEDVWTGSRSHFDEYEHITDFSTRPENFKFGPANNFGHPRALLSDQTRLLEISDIEEEFKEENKMPENLRAVNMLGSDKKMASLEENQQNPMDSVFQMYQSEVEAEGEKNEYNSNFELHNISNNYIYPQYQFDPSPSGLINNRNYNAYDATQRVDVNHSLFRSSCGIAETIFHYIEPLRKVIVVEKSILPQKDNERMPSLFRKMRESIQGKFMAMKFSMKACKRSFSHKSTVNDLLSLTTGLLASCIYLGDSSEQAVLRKRLISDA